MNVLHGYAIAFKGLSDGEHKYEFDIDDSFFRAFEESEIKGGAFKVDVDLKKMGSTMILWIDVQGQVDVECDRCLELFSMDVEYESELTVRVGEVDQVEYDEDLMWLPVGEDSIPLGQYLYESIYLSLPYQRVHPDDEDGNPTCDPEALKKFRIVTQEQFDELVQETEGSEETYKPFEQLAELKKKMENLEK